MSSLNHWLYMGGYAQYVWSAYGFGLVILIGNVISAKRAHQKVIQLEK